jgi:hypothetical protein
MPAMSTLTERVIALTSLFMCTPRRRVPTRASQQLKATELFPECWGIASESVLDDT